MIATVAVGTDGSETAGKAVQAAIDLAKQFEAKIVFISSYKPLNDMELRKEQRDAPPEHHWRINPTSEVDAILREVEELAEGAGLKWASEAMEGDPAEVILALAEKHGADVIVVGNKGMERKVLGSVPNTVSHKASCSVFIVKTT